MQRESQAPSIERPHPFEHRRNLSDRAFSTCPSSCEQAIQLDWGDSPIRYACPRSAAHSRGRCFSGEPPDHRMQGGESGGIILRPRSSAG